MELRTKLQDAVSVCLQQDVRDGQLLVSFVAVDGNLQVTTGHLGQCDLNEHFGLSAKEIAEASVFIIHKFASTGLGMPVRDGDDGKRTAVLDHELVRILKERTEAFAADGASDEQRAGHDFASILKNLQIYHESCEGNIAVFYEFIFL